MICIFGAAKQKEFIEVFLLAISGIFKHLGEDINCCRQARQQSENNKNLKINQLTLKVVPDTHLGKGFMKKNIFISLISMLLLISCGNNLNGVYKNTDDKSLFKEIEFVGKNTVIIRSWMDLSYGYVRDGDVIRLSGEASGVFFTVGDRKTLIGGGMFISGEKFVKQ